ncbi:MAG: anti-sigma factor antagonist [Acidobacteria bacterium]|nr:anti-sigma factor antagonist [Acidobacteriota bacterium]NIM60380.1 anti-sigma factor antagonist [Acidobacteriota bacterium]NIO60315.1 anti-sigma factor antagonist [Acidobacteriota bacterium]NIQ31370.1 anti-sigma factor antagonist [Acidobacteriota bacterium]NIQ86593.1 anti-sigma factor antagonist [Acidobacteriota bacterium]
MELYYDDTDKEVMVLSVHGGLLADNAHHFVSGVEKYIALGMRKLIIDCSGLTKISSYGIGTLVRMHKRMQKKGGDVKLAAVSGVAGKVMRMTGIGEVLQIYAAVEDARLAFAATDVDARDHIDARHPHLED